MTTILPITEPLGRYWDQPPVSDILVDDHHAVMTKETFEQLKEYTLTNPTGVYPGKMWSSKLYIRPNRETPAYWSGRWLLCWYGFSKKGEDFCSNNSREILFID